MTELMKASRHYAHSSHKGRKLVETIINKRRKKIKRPIRSLDLSKPDWSVTR